MNTKEGGGHDHFFGLRPPGAMQEVAKDEEGQEVKNARTPL